MICLHIQFVPLRNGTEKGLFAPAPARFYGAEVLLALEFLHKVGLYKLNSALP
jgi:hypothetical protein